MKKPSIAEPQDVKLAVASKLAGVFLDFAHERFLSGDKSALLCAIKDCVRLNAPIPKWVADAFVEAYEMAHDPQCMSWDKVFGRPHGVGKKSTHIAFIRKNWFSIGNAVFLHRLRGKKLNAEDYESIAQDLGTNSQMVKAAWNFYKTYVSPDPFESVKKRKGTK